MPVRNRELTVDTLINLMIIGIHQKVMPMRDPFNHNAIAWLVEAAGLATVPDDWRERVRIGSDRKQSGTASENLTGEASRIPNVLTDQQRALVDYAAPGLRALLGYA